MWKTSGSRWISTIIRPAGGSFYPTRVVRQMDTRGKAESLTKFRIEFPGGFSYGAFNGAGYIKPWSLLRMADASRGVAVSPPDSDDSKSYLDTSRWYDKYFAFLLATSMQVKKEFYSIDFIKAPIKIDLELEYVGEKSFQLKSTSFVNDMPEPMYVSREIVVPVCKESRLPKPLPDWWFEKFAKEIPAGSKPAERLDMSGKNDAESTTSNFTVDAADVDGYLHVNSSNYVKYCYNAFVAHCLAKADTNSPVEIFRKMSHMSMVYKKELDIGDEVTSTVSPHLSDPNTFYFSIVKGQHVSCECEMKFHPL